MTFKRTLFICLLLLFSLFSNKVCAQANKPNGYKVGEKVEVVWSGSAYKAEIIKVDGERYRVRYDGYDIKNDEWVRASRFNTNNKLPKGVSKILPGKYFCFSDEYNQNTGMTEFTNRGSLIFHPNGKYEYLGHKKPSVGTYTVKANGVISLKGGYMDGGQATPMPRPNKFYLVFPNIIGNRWSCEPAKK